MLNLIQQQTERLISELKWNDKQIENFIVKVNNAVTKRLENNANDETDSSLVVHPAKYSGGFILFGGWTKIFDNIVPSGTLGHELYLAFGGLGAGGWNGDCDIELDTEGSFSYP